jgi:putative ABC transport system ATP-binding protein
MKKVIIEATNLHKSYKMSKKNIVHALNGADIKIMQGEFAAIIGPSGCGKSTLMHILGLLDRPDEGKLVIDGLDIAKTKKNKLPGLRSKKIGFIFQGFNLIPTLSALENVVLAARYGGKKSKQAKRLAVEMLTKVGLGERMKHGPTELSGGQQQRVAIARALINDPTVVLADEPTGELDSKTSKEIITMLKELNRKTGQTFLMVTHNLDVAKECKRIIEMRDGRVVGDRHLGK